jgi:hypothetical protein
VRLRACLDSETRRTIICLCGGMEPQSPGRPIRDHSTGCFCFAPGAAAASRLYVEAINKLARQAQQGTWGGSSDIGE